MDICHWLLRNVEFKRSFWIAKQTLPDPPTQFNLWSHLPWSMCHDFAGVALVAGMLWRSRSPPGGASELFVPAPVTMAGLLVIDICLAYLMMGSLTPILMRLEFGPSVWRFRIPMRVFAAADRTAQVWLLAMIISSCLQISLSKRRLAIILLAGAFVWAVFPYQLLRVSIAWPFLAAIQLEYILRFSATSDRQTAALPNLSE